MSCMYTDPSQPSPLVLAGGTGRIVGPARIAGVLNDTINQSINRLPLFLIHGQNLGGQIQNGNVGRWYSKLPIVKTKTRLLGVQLA